MKQKLLEYPKKWLHGLLRHLKTLKGEKHIITYSDMSGGQNRNIKISLI